jgi:tetratricopeptide (TPR) repeat protein
MSLGVLPMQGPGEGRVSRAVTREIAAMLARSTPLVSVVPVPPSLAQAPVDAPGAIARAVGVRCLLEGELRPEGESNVLDARLIDASTGAQLWSESTLLPSDAMARARTLHALVWHASRAMITAEVRRVLADAAATTPIDDVLRAIALARTESDPDKRFRERLRLLENTLSREPNLVPAIISLVILLDQRLDFDVDADLDAIGRRMDELTTKAVRLNDVQPTAWFMRTVALAACGKWEGALEACMKAIRLEPFSSGLVLNRAGVMAMTGKPREALALVEEAVAMDPQRNSPQAAVACMTHVLLGDYEAAIVAGEQSIALGGGDSPHDHLYLAAAYAEAGNLDKARAAREAMLRLVPGFRIGKYRWRKPVAHPAWISLAERHLQPGLRRAGFVD